MSKPAQKQPGKQSKKPSKKPSKKVVAKRVATKPASPITPAPDANLKARFEAELERFTRARGGEMAEWDEMYEALDAILYSDPPLYLAASYKTARAFLARYLPGVSETTVRASVRVARYFDPADETKHGISKLGLLLDYLEAAGGAPLTPAKIAPDHVRIPVARGKTTAKVAITDLSFDELRAAVRTARGEGKAPAKTKVSPRAMSVRAALSKWKLGTVGVRVRGDKLDLTGISLSQLAALAKALVAVRLPE